MIFAKISKQYARFNHNILHPKWTAQSLYLRMQRVKLDTRVSPVTLLAAIRKNKIQQRFSSSHSGVNPAVGTRLRPAPSFSWVRCLKTEIKIERKTERQRKRERDRQRKAQQFAKKVRNTSFLTTPIIRYLLIRQKLPFLRLRLSITSRKEENKERERERDPSGVCQVPATSDRKEGYRSTSPRIIIQC